VPNGSLATGPSPSAAAADETALRRRSLILEATGTGVAHEAIRTVGGRVVTAAVLTVAVLTPSTALAKLRPAGTLRGNDVQHRMTSSSDWTTALVLATAVAVVLVVAALQATHVLRGHPVAHA
jgi:hypothetical protein